MKTVAERIVLIPCYRPDRNLSRLVIRLNEMNIRVILINDGSGTEYDAIFRNLSIFAVVLDHKEQLGKCSALITGLEYINAQYIRSDNCKPEQSSARNLSFAADLEVYNSSDPDGYSPQRIESLLSRVEDSPRQLLVNKKKNRSGSLFHRLRPGKRLTGFYNGLWAFDGSMTDIILTAAAGTDNTESDILTALRHNKVSIREITLSDRASSFTAGRYCYG